MNVLISAAFPRAGAPAELIRRWRDGEFELIASERLLAELREALRYPKVAARIPDADADELVAALRAYADIAADAAPVGTRSRDPDDDYLLGLAQSTGAVLVTGDKGLLALGDLPVMSPAAFLRSLSG